MHHVSFDVLKFSVTNPSTSPLHVWESTLANPGIAPSLKEIVGPHLAIHKGTHPNLNQLGNSEDITTPELTE